TPMARLPNSTARAAAHEVDSLPIRTAASDNDNLGHRGLTAGRYDHRAATMLYSAIYRFNSIVVIAASTNEKVPLVLASVAAVMSAVTAARYSEVARVMRRTPTSASAVAVKDLPLMPTIKLKGLESDAHTRSTAARSGKPGAISTSAPALS